MIPEPTPPRSRQNQPLATRLRVTLLRISRRLRVESGGSLAEGQLSVLALLFAHGPLSAGELAEREHVRPPSMTRTLKYLEDHGYIDRAPHPSDRRSVVVELSEEGATYINQTRRRRDQWLQRRLAALTVEERRTLAEAERILRKVVDA